MCIESNLQNWPFWCWDWDIQGESHGCWCRGFLRLQGINSHGIDVYVESEWPHGPLVRYVKLLVEHAPGMPGTFPRHREIASRHASRHVHDDMRHGTCMTHVPWSPTNGFLWCWWRGKSSRHSRRMLNPQFYVSGKRSMAEGSYHRAYTSLWPSYCGLGVVIGMHSKGFQFQW